MIINLTNQWRISTDSLNYILEKKRIGEKGKNAGQEIYTPVAYCSNIQNCINNVLEREIKSAEVESLKALKLHIDKVQAEIVDMIGSQNMP